MREHTRVMAEKSGNWSVKKRTPRTEKVAAEPWEVEGLHREFPVKSREELEQTLERCKTEATDPRDKGKITRCVQRKLTK
jgi:hypothetical protein